MSDGGKRLAKELARPVLRPLLARMAYLRGRVDVAEGQVQAANSRVAEVERNLLTTEKALNELLDAITMQNALARQTRREQVRSEQERIKNLSEAWQAQTQFAEALARVEHRLEFIRREVMLELRYGEQGPGSG